MALERTSQYPEEAVAVRALASRKLLPSRVIPSTDTPWPTLKRVASGPIWATDPIAEVSTRCRV